MHAIRRLEGPRNGVHPWRAAASDEFGQSARRSRRSCCQLDIYERMCCHVAECWRGTFESVKCRRGLTRAWKVLRSKANPLGDLVIRDLGLLSQPPSQPMCLAHTFIEHTLEDVLMRGACAVVRADMLWSALAASPVSHVSHHDKWRRVESQSYGRPGVRHFN